MFDQSLSQLRNEGWKGIIPRGMPDLQNVTFRHDGLVLKVMNLFAEGRVMGFTFDDVVLSGEYMFNKEVINFELLHVGQAAQFALGPWELLIRRLLTPGDIEPRNSTTHDRGQAAGTGTACRHHRSASRAHGRPQRRRASRPRASGVSGWSVTSPPSLPVAPMI